MSERVKGSIPNGCVLSDKKNKKWIIKSYDGVAGKTENYLGARHNGETTTDLAVVIKVELYQSGRLSTDIKFYIDNAYPIQIDKWIRKKRIQDFGLGIPRLLGSGSHEYNGNRYHFIVIKKYDTDLWTLFVENGRQFPAHTVYKVAMQILRVLQYIHSRGYIHANIEGKNLFLDSASERRVYLTHASNATVEYLSVDSHRGEPTMRGDLEALLYNTIRWFGCSLPWDDHLNDYSKVKQLKKDAFKHTSKFLHECFTTSEVPAPISEFASLLSSMHRLDKPDYKQLKDIFTKGLRMLHHAPNGRLQWKVDIIVDKSDKELPEQNKKDESIPGIHVSVKLLAGIISENCRNLSEVDLQSTKLGSLLDIIHRLTILSKKDECKIRKLQLAWHNDEAKLRTKVLELWKGKGIIIDSAPVERTVEANQESPATSAAVNTNALSYNSASVSTSQSHRSWTCQNGTPSMDSPNSPSPEDDEVHRHLLSRVKTIKKKKLQPGTNAKSTQRKRKRQNRTPWPNKRNRNCNSLKDHAAGETSEYEDHMHRQRSLSPSMVRRVNIDATSFGSSSCEAVSGARSAFIFQSKRDSSPFSPVSSSGIGSHNSDRDGFLNKDSSLLTRMALSRDKQWESTYKRLTAWLTLKSQNLEVFGPISSESQTLDSQVEQLRVLREEFRTQQHWLDHLTKVLRELPADSDDAQKLKKIEQCWHDLLSRLEDLGQKMIDARLNQRRDALQKISNDLEKLLLHKDQEQLLHKLKNLVNQLEIQRQLLAKTTDEELHQISSSSALSSNVRTKLRNIEEIYLNLQQKIEAEKFDSEKNFSSKDQFEDSCKEVNLWLDDKLADMSEKVLVSTACVPQQFDQHKIFHQHVMSREIEVMKLLKKGREDLPRSPNVESRIIQQRYLDSMQAKWNRLTKRSFENLTKLKTCFSLGQDYHQGQVQFSPWLKKIEDKFDSLKLVLSKHEDDIKKQLDELSVLSNEVREKSDEFKRINSQADAFIGSCDVDKDDTIKKELITIKCRWDNLDTDLHKRINSLKDTFRQLANLNERLRDIESKLELPENESASVGVFVGAARTEQLERNTESLRKALYDVHQDVEELILKAREQGIDVSHLRNGVKRVLGSIDNFDRKSLTQKFAIKIENENETTTTQSQNNNVLIDQKPIVTLSNTNRILEEIDLVSSDEDEGDVGSNSKGASTRQHAESPSLQRSNLEQLAQSREQETLTNEEPNLNAAELEKSIKEEPL